MDDKIKVLIAVPCYDKPEVGFFESMIELLPYTTSKYHAYIYVQERMMLEHARNLIVKNIFSKGDYTHLCFIDDDMMFPPDTLVKLIEDDKEIVSALNFKRSQPFLPAIYKRDIGAWKHHLDYPRTYTFETDAFGLAFCLIKREVFEKLKYPYFYQTYDDKNGFTEGDLNFCYKAKKHYSLWCDPAAKTGHIGKTIIGENHYLAFTEQSKQINHSKIITSE